MTSTQLDLFDVGERLPVDVPRYVPGSRRKILTADLPGTGPEGETCGTCAHLVHTGNSGRYLKCGLMRKDWTHGPGTDLRARWPACSKWEKAGGH